MVPSSPVETRKSGSPEISGLAVSSLVLGILSCFCLPMLAAILAITPMSARLYNLFISLPILVSIPTIIFGHVSRATIRRSASHITGASIALGGLILGYTSTPVVIGLLTWQAMARADVFAQVDSTVARAGMARYCIALDAYKRNNGNYPTTEQGLQALIAPPNSESVPRKWRGPYIDPPVIQPDPWKRALIYAYPPKHNPDPEGFDLYSVGPDGHPNTDDDIVNWK